MTGHGNEYQLTDALDRLLKQGKKFKIATVDEWLDCGTIPAWLETTKIILKKEQHAYDAGLYKNTEIIPPVFIGENVSLENSKIGPNASIGKDTVIKDSNVSDSIVLEESHILKSDLTQATIGNHTKIKNFKGSTHLGDHSSIH